MFKRTINLLLAFLFFISGIIFPLGDFSLMRDIPYMYQNYSRVTTAEELCVVDFIGDYLLHGKDLFGNNRNDKPQNQDNAVQFQHQANSLQVVFLQIPITLSLILEYKKQHTILTKLFLHTSGYQSDLFRPPLA